MDRIPEGVLKQLAERQAKDAAQRAMFGAARLPITFRSHGYRIVGVHDEIRWFPESRLFHDFLDDYSAMLLGYEWGQQQLTLPESERHPVLGWRAARSRLPTSAITRDADGNFSAHASAAMACWLRLGWDFFTTRDADLLTRDILQRLRSRDHFQGARHELAVVALFNRAGYDVKHVKAGKATKTPEFIGTHGTGLKLAVEAKARQRYGVLGSKIGPKPDDWRVADSYHLLKNAAAKMADDPLIAVIELNLPPSPMGQPQNWGEQVNGMLERLKSENSPVPDLMVFWSSCDYHLGDAAATPLLPTIIAADSKTTRLPPAVADHLRTAVDQWKHVPTDWPE